MKQKGNNKVKLRDIREIDQNIYIMIDLLDEKLLDIEENYKEDITKYNFPKKFKIILEEIATDKRHYDKLFPLFEKYGIKEPKIFLEKIGFDFDNNLTPEQNNIKINTEENKPLNETSTKEDLFKIFTTDNFDKLNDEDRTNNIETFLVELFEFEKTEINGLFIEVIKNDFDEIKEIINKVNNDYEIKNKNQFIQYSLMDLINNRGLKIENNKAIEPFSNLTIFKTHINFNYNIANIGMPDIIYFPKNNNKNIVANNITSNNYKEYSYSIFHYFYQISNISNIVDGKINKHIANIKDFINDNKNILKEIVNVSKYKTEETFKLIQKDLENGKKLEEIFNIDRLSFTTTLKSSAMTVFNQQKEYKKDDEDNKEKIKELKEIENINTLIFFLSLIESENQEFSSKEKNQTEENNEVNNKNIEKILNKINIGILSPKGFYTESNNNTVKESVTIILEYLSNPKTTELFEKYNKTKNGYTNVLKSIMQKGIRYIVTYYSEILINYQLKNNLLTSNKVFGNCILEKKDILEKILEKQRKEVMNFFKDYGKLEIIGEMLDLEDDKKIFKIYQIVINMINKKDSHFKINKDCNNIDTFIDFYYDTK